MVMLCSVCRRSPAEKVGCIPSSEIRNPQPFLSPCFFSSWCLLQTSFSPFPIHSPPSPRVLPPFLPSPPLPSQHMLTVTPVVAVLPPDAAASFVPRANQSEVEAVFSAPLALFLQVPTAPWRTTHGVAWQGMAWHAETGCNQT